MSKHYRPDDDQLAASLAASDQAAANRGYDKAGEQELFRWACGFREMEDDPALLSCANPTDFFSDREAELRTDERMRREDENYWDRLERVS